MRLILFNSWCRNCCWRKPPHSCACVAPWKYGMLQIMRRRREKQRAMKIEEVAMNWNNFYATLPIWIFPPPCREPTTAVSATFGNRPAALSSSGGDAGAHHCPRFHLKLYAAQILGEPVRWCKTWRRYVQVLEHFDTKPMLWLLFLSIFGPVSLPSLFSTMNIIFGCIYDECHAEWEF